MSRIYIQIALPILAACFIVVACQNPFSMRKAEEPTGNQSKWEPASSPSQLMLNFTNAIQTRDLELYLRCLVDTAFTDKRFLFIPDPAVLESHALTFANWTIENEKEVMNLAFQLIPKDSSIQLLFTENLAQIIAPDSAVFMKAYQFDLHHAQDNPPTTYEGVMEVVLTEDQRGEWVIYRWSDQNSDSETQTWSFLKASLGG